MEKIVGWFTGPAIWGGIKAAVSYLVSTGAMLYHKIQPWVANALGLTQQWLNGIFGKTYGMLSRAAEYGLQPYKNLVKALKGTGLQAHHLIELRFSSTLGKIYSDISVAVTKAEHQAFTNHWRSLLPYGKTYTLQQVWEAAQKVYAKISGIIRSSEKSVRKITVGGNTNMRIKHRFGFNIDEKAVIRFLDNHNIKYNKDETTINFEMFEDDEKFNLINDFMGSNNAVRIQDAVYTREEIEGAKWLTVRSSWWSQYPQPEADMKYKYTTYDATNYCDGGESDYSCGKGLIQREPFILKKEPNWGSRNFMMLNWISDELFINKKTVEMLLNSDLKGFEIYDVWNKSKKKMEGVKQIFVKSYLPKGISINSIEREYVCPKCGFRKYWLKTGEISFNKNIFDGIQCDIVKTSDKFGEGNCDSLILVTRKFYDVIKTAKLDRGLVFEPIRLI